MSTQNASSTKSTLYELTTQYASGYRIGTVINQSDPANLLPAEVAIKTVHADHVCLESFQRFGVEELNIAMQKQTEGSSKRAISIMTL